MALIAGIAGAQLAVMGLIRGVADDDALAQELAYLLFYGREPDTGDSALTFEESTSVYLRPGEPGVVTGTLTSGEKVDVWRDETIGDDTWYYVSTSTVAGWVHADLLTVTPAARPAAAYVTRPQQRIGGDTHYADFDSTGHLTFAGNARPWRDELGQLLGMKRKGSRITEDLDEGTLLFADTCQIADDWVITNVQLNHDKDLAASIYPHIHWIQASSDVPNWMIQYRWQIQGGAKTTSWTSAKYTSLATTYDGDPATINQIAVFAAIAPPVGAGLSDIVQFRILRDTDNDSTLFGTPGTDPLSGNAVAVMFDVHFMINSLGSTDEYSK